MNKDYLLTCLMEECAELAQAASKAIRFGLSDHNPETGIKNIEQLEMEFNDLLGIIELLNDHGVSVSSSPAQILAKYNKVMENYTRYYRSDLNE